MDVSSWLASLSSEEEASQTLQEEQLYWELSNKQEEPKKFIGSGEDAYL